MSRKRKKWEGRIYIGRDESGKQKFHHVGRFDTRRERDQAVAEARVALASAPSSELPTCCEPLASPITLPPIRFTRTAAATT